MFLLDQPLPRAFKGFFVSFSLGEVSKTNANSIKY